MKIGLTFDKREDYNIESDSEIFADFCSKDEVAYMADAIRERGYEVELIGNMHALNAQILAGSFSCDLVFLADEGIRSRNREAIVPALLELNGIPYVGSDAYAMGLSQNKFHTKLVAASLGIVTPKVIYIPFEMMGSGELESYIAAEMEKLGLSFPIVVKTNCEGYSMGVFKVNNRKELMDKVLWNMENYRQEVLCEEYIPGDEINVPVIGTGSNAYVLGVDLCKYADGSPIDIFTLWNKCFEPILDEAVEYDAQTMETLCDWTLKLHRHMQCRHFSRADYKITRDKKIYFIEMNPRPGLTQNGPFETCAKNCGKTYAEVLDEIIQSALNDGRN